LGVGLGASGFYIYSGLPDWALTTVPEIARQLSPTNALYPNPKNLYVRLLAETGLLGFVLFMAFLLHVLGDTLSALRQRVPRWRYLGIAALFTWLALFAYNMTQDSFAIPNLWINFGILAGIVGADMSSFS
jgi:O-antigen ligase